MNSDQILHFAAMLFCMCIVIGILFVKRANMSSEVSDISDWRMREIAGVAYRCGIAPAMRTAIVVIVISLLTPVSSAHICVDFEQARSKAEISKKA